MRNKNKKIRSRKNTEAAKKLHENPPEAGGVSSGFDALGSWTGTPVTHGGILGKKELTPTQDADDL